MSETVIVYQNGGQEGGNLLTNAHEQPESRDDIICSLKASENATEDNEEKIPASEVVKFRLEQWNKKLELMNGHGKINCDLESGVDGDDVDQSPVKEGVSVKKIAHTVNQNGYKQDTWFISDEGIEPYKFLAGSDECVIDTKAELPETGMVKGLLQRWKSEIVLHQTQAPLLPISYMQVRIFYIKNYENSVAMNGALPCK